MIEECLYGLTFLVSQFALIVSLKALPVKSKNSANLSIEIAVKEEVDVFLEHLHEGSAFDEDS